MEPIDLTIDEVLTTTRNVRKRIDLEGPVEGELVEECLDLALQAPNGSNSQNREWLAIDDEYTQAGIFPVAYTIGTDFRPVQRRPASEVLHWNAFEAS